MPPIKTDATRRAEMDNEIVLGVLDVVAGDSTITQGSVARRVRGSNYGFQCGEGAHAQPPPRPHAEEYRGDLMRAGAQWYVVHTQPHNEGRAEAHLRRQGFNTYLPRYLCRRRHARRSETVARPLFPRYLFVTFDLARDRWRSIQSTFGVSNLVLTGDTPKPLAGSVVDEIRGREGADGFVTLGLPAGLKPGSSVRLIDGLFADYEGVLERIAGDTRVAVLLSLLGRKVRVFVPAASVGID